jgi:periplasmic protein TonB
MTAAALERYDLSRWALSAVVVIAIHAAAGILLLNWHEPVTGDEGRDAIVVDLSAFTGPPNESKYDLPPGPLQLQPQMEAAPQPEPPKPEERPQEKTEVPPPQPDAEVTLPAEPVKPPEKPVEQPAPPVRETAPPRIRPSAAQVASWHRKIAQQVEHHKGYPAAARARHQTGVAEVIFTIDRAGKVVASQVVRSSGYAALDQETIATVKRAQPFPSPPANMSGEAFEFRVPIRFDIQ